MRRSWPISIVFIALLLFGIATKLWWQRPVSPSGPPPRDRAEGVLYVEPVGVNLSIRLDGREVAVVPPSLAELPANNLAQVDGCRLKQPFRSESLASNALPAFEVQALLPEGWTVLTAEEVSIEESPAAIRGPTLVEVRLKLKDRFHEAAYIDNRGGAAVSLAIGRCERVIPADFAGRLPLARPRTGTTAQVQLGGRLVGIAWPLPSTASGREGALVIDVSGMRMYLLTNYLDGDPSGRPGPREVQRFGPGFIHSLNLPINLFLEPPPQWSPYPHTMGTRSCLVLSEVK